MAGDHPGGVPVEVREAMTIWIVLAAVACETEIAGMFTNIDAACYERNPHGSFWLKECRVYEHSTDLAVFRLV
jgi:hypothetical protein